MSETIDIIRTTIETTINSIIENSNLLFFDKSALLLSILAIIISVWAVFKNEYSQYKNKFYDGIFLKPLQEELPSLINNAINTEQYCINQEACTELEEYIGNFRKRILVFKYMNEKFYKKIDNILIDIDQQLVIMNNRNENFEEKYSNLLKTINKLYKESKKYIIFL